MHGGVDPFPPARLSGPCCWLVSILYRTPSRMPTPLRASRLAQAFAGLVVLTTMLVVLGALVRAHGAGLACPDWPLCFGRLVPSFDLKIAFEWSHRVLAGSVGLLYLGLAALVMGDPRLRPRLARPVLAGAALLGLQVTLGALTVWHLLARWTVTSHLLAGNLFNTLLLWIALELGRSSAPPTHPRPPASTRAWVGALAALLLLQMGLGGLVSSGHAGLACPEWPTCNGGSWFPTWRGAVGLHLLHRWNGALLGSLFLATAWSLRHEPGPVRRRMGLAAALAIAQVAVGVLNVVLGIPVEITGLHSALAAALLLSVAGALHACYNAAPGYGAVSGEGAARHGEERAT